MSLVKERFMGYVHTHHTGCHIWAGGQRSDYGVFSYQKTSYSAHRFAYMLYVGHIPKGMLVCHTCDVPLCVNPAHLYLGTDQDNADDRVERGRSSRQGGPGTKLTDDAVREIRKLSGEGVNRHVLAARFGVGAPMITRIKNFRSWKNVS